MLDTDDDTTNRERSAARASFYALAAAIVALLMALLFLGYRILQRLDDVQRRVAISSADSSEAAGLARQALHRATDAEASARAAALGRELAEAETAGALEASEAAREETEAARQEAARAREAAARAEAEAARIRSDAEAEVNRLEQALGQVAETRRTALGVVMSLGGDYLKFEFDKAELRSEDRELLSRVAGILLTSKDYSLSVNGHTDDVGSDVYNQELSERRAQAVRDYLVGAGLSAEIFTVIGHGKARPLVPGKTDEARAKNRRVELGIVNTKIRYGRSTEE